MAKRIISLLVLLILFMALPIAAVEVSSEFKPGSEPDGFRGIKWGTDISTLKGMKLIKDDGPEKYYQKKDDNMTIGMRPRTLGLRSMNRCSPRTNDEQRTEGSNQRKVAGSAPDRSPLSTVRCSLTTAFRTGTLPERIFAVRPNSSRRCCRRVRPICRTEAPDHIAQCWH